MKSKRAFLNGVMGTFSKLAIATVLILPDAEALRAESFPNEFDSGDEPGGIETQSSRPKLIAGDQQSFVVLADGRAFAWGNNLGNRLGVSRLPAERPSAHITVPLAIQSGEPDPRWSEIYTLSRYQNIGIADDGSVHLLGSSCRNWMPVPLSQGDATSRWIHFATSFAGHSIAGLSAEMTLESLTTPCDETGTAHPFHLECEVEVGGWSKLDPLMDDRGRIFEIEAVPTGGQDGRFLEFNHQARLLFEDSEATWKNAGRMSLYGRNIYWMLGYDDRVYRFNPLLETVPKLAFSSEELPDCRSLSVGSGIVTAISRDGRLFCWNGLDWNGSVPWEAAIPPQSNGWLDSASGLNHLIAMADNGALYEFTLTYSETGATWTTNHVDFFSNLLDPTQALSREPPSNYPPLVESFWFDSANEPYLPQKLDILARAVDWDGHVTHVEFYLGNEYLGLDAVPENGIWSVSFQITVGGSYTVTAVPHDDLGEPGEPMEMTIPVAANRVPWVGVKTIVPTTSESAEEPSYFVLHRDAHTNELLTVEVMVQGTATAGEDYEPLETSYTFHAGETSIAIPLVIYQDALEETDETIELILTATGCGPLEDRSSGCYHVAANNRDIILIESSDNADMKAPAEVALIVRDQLAIEDSKNNGMIELIRTGEQDTELPVLLHWSGNADFAIDYFLDPANTSIPAGRTNLWIEVVAIGDGETEGLEELTVTVMTSDPASENPKYGVNGSANTGTVFILDPIPVPPLPYSPTSPELADSSLEETEIKVLLFRRLSLNGSGSWQLEMIGDPGIQAELQQSADLVHWTTLKTIRSSGQVKVHPITVGTSESVYYRLRPIN